MKVKTQSEVTLSCLTLSDPMDCNLPGFSIHGNFQARVLEWGAIAFSNKACYIYFIHILCTIDKTLFVSKICLLVKVKVKLLSCV